MPVDFRGFTTLTDLWINSHRGARRLLIVVDFARCPSGSKDRLWWWVGGCLLILHVGFAMGQHQLYLSGRKIFMFGAIVLEICFW